MSNFMKIRLVADEFFHAAIRKADGQTNGRTDMMKIIVAFRNFGKVPNNISSLFPCAGLHGP